MTSFTSASDAHESLVTAGYAVVPNVLRVDEVLELRDIIQLHLKGNKGGVASSFGKVEPLGVLAIPGLRKLIADRRIMDRVRDLLSTPDPEFLLHCDAHYGDRSTWHKDTGEGIVPNGYFGHPVYDYEECLVVKLAIYCEDHIDDDHGLHVKPGSHHSSDLETGSEVAVNTRVGDLVAFDVRITHMGDRENFRHRAMNGVRLRLPPALRGPVGGFFSATDAALSRETERTSLFFSFAAKGVQSELTKRFARSNWERACRQVRRDFNVPENVIEEFSLLNVDVVTL
jgi:hypothetical protein